MRLIRCCIPVIFALLAVAPPGAEEGRIPIFEPIVLDATTQPDFSGNYVVTRNISTNGFDESVIRIRGDCTQNVEIDLNGFELAKTSAAYSTIDVRDVRTLVVRNGSVVTGPMAGGVTVALWSCAGSTLVVENLKLRNSLVALQSAHVFFRNNVLSDVDGGTTFGALSVGGGGGLPPKGEIKNNILRGIENTGMHITAGRGLAVVENYVEATGTAIRVEGYVGIRVERNTLEGPENGALPTLDMPHNCRSCQIIDNQASGGSGFYFKDIETSQIGGNSVDTSSEFANGLHFVRCSGNRIYDNVVLGSQYGAGILLAGDVTGSNFNTIVGNHVTGFQLGIHMPSPSQGNSYGRNVVPRNLGGGTCPGQVAPTCTAPGLCDEGVSNTTFGDNLTPGPPPC